MTSGKYLQRYMMTNTKDAFLTLFQTNVDDGIHRFGEHTSPWNNIRTFYPESFRAFKSAQQQREGFDFQAINNLMRYGMLGLLMITACA